MDTLDTLRLLEAAGRRNGMSAVAAAASSALADDPVITPTPGNPPAEALTSAAAELDSALELVGQLADANSALTDEVMYLRCLVATKSEPLAAYRDGLVAKFRAKPTNELFGFYDDRYVDGMPDSAKFLLATALNQVLQERNAVQTHDWLDMAQYADYANVFEYERELEAQAAEAAQQQDLTDEELDDASGSNIEDNNE